jgi:hypothetical protein
MPALCHLGSQHERQRLHIALLSAALVGSREMGTRMGGQQLSLGSARLALLPAVQQACVASRQPLQHSWATRDAGAAS